MTCRQRHDLIAPAKEVQIGADVKRCDSLLDELGERHVNFAFVAGAKHDELRTERSRRDLSLIQLQRCI